MDFDDKIERYFNNTLTQQEKNALEAQIRTSDKLKQHFDAHHLAHKILGMNQHLQLLEIVENIAAEERAKKKSLVGRIRHWIEKLGLDNIFQINMETLVKRQFSPYLAAVSLMGASDNPSNVFIQGMKQYDLQHYMKAIVLLKQVPSTHPNYLEAQFYLGNAFLALQKPALAIICLEEVIDNSETDNDYYSSANWYRALALLQLEEKSMAMKVLQQIKAYSNDPFYQNKAVKLMEKL